MTTQTNGANGLMTTARRISEERRAEVGLSMPALNPDNVPPSVRPLLKHAEILGIGDDVVRGNVFDEVSTQYLDVVRGAISEIPGFFDWYREAETTDAKHSPEVAAIGWMLFGLNLG